MSQKTFLCFGLSLLACVGCNRTVTRDPKFVDTWKGTVKYETMITSDSAAARVLDEEIKRRYEEDWRTGRSGTTLTVHPNGTFNMKVWSPATKVDAPVAEIPGLNIEAKGTWRNSGDVLILKGDDFLPYAYTAVTRSRLRRSTREQRHQELRLQIYGDTMTNRSDITFTRIQPSR